MSTSITKNNALRLALALVAGIAFAMSAMPFGAADAGAPGKFDICHFSSENASKPFVKTPVDESSIINNGHGDHGEDIIPEFGEGDFEDGQNLDTDYETTDGTMNGQEILDADCDVTLVSDDDKEEFTLSATKLVCDSTDDLPNWSGSGENIEAKTATQYAQNNNCEIVDWEFQWAPTEVSTTVEEDNSGELAGWTTFSGSKTFEINDFSEISVREVMKKNYLPFTAEETSGTPSEASAEFWCHDDVLNYDNLEYIDVEDGGEYHCVAFNVEEAPETETFTFKGHKYEVFADSDIEEPVKDWEMRLYEVGAGEKGGDNAVATTSTDADGYFKFEVDLEEGESPSNYFVMEEFREGWEVDRLEVDGQEQAENMYGCRVPEFGHDSLEVMVEGSDGVSQDQTSVQCDFFNQQAEEEIADAQISPIFECVKEQREGHYQAYFSYETHNNVNITIEEGDDNKLTGNVTSGTPVTEFTYPAPDYPSDDRMGRTGFYPKNAFSVTFSGDELVWTLKGPDGQRRTATAASDGTACPVDDDEQDDEVIEEEEEDETQQPAQRQSGNAANAASAAGAVAGAATSSEPEGEVLGEATRQCGPILNTYMRQNQTNDQQQVMILQAFLTGQGINTPLTGEFDSTTDASVRAYQARYKSEILTPWYEAGIVPHENPTGYAYKLTRHKINNTVCPGSEPMPELN